MNTERVVEINPDYFREIETHKDDLFVDVKELLAKDPKENDEAFLMEKIQGFSPSRLTAKYIQLNEQMLGATRQEINEVFGKMVDTETRHYAAEFLYRSPVLQTEYSIRNVNGIPSVVMPHYDPDSPLHTHISLKERDGATFYGVLNLERAILQATEHSTIVYTSSSGWNGTGEAFTEAQVHAVNIVDGQIIDTVLRLSLTPQESQAFVENLSNQKLVSQTEIEKIKEISETVIAFPFDLPPQALLSKVKQIKGTETAWQRMKFVGESPVFDKVFTFEEMSLVLEKDSFLETNAEVDTIISELKDYLVQNSDTDPESLRKMVRYIGKAALEISESIGVEVGELSERKTQKGDYSGATKYAAEGLGCDAVSSTSSREAQYAKEGIEAKCTQCGEYAKTICGWCIRCAVANENYKKVKQEVILKENDTLDKGQFTGSFLGAIIVGALMAFSKN